MIEYRLQCKNQHEWNAWFRSADDFTVQCQKKLVTCPYCASHEVEKTLMTPSIGSAGRKRSANSASDKPALAHEDQAKQDKLQQMHKLYSMMYKMAQEVQKTHEDVGDRFAQEARAMHYGEKDAKNILGQASSEQVEELLDEGIAIAPLPVFPKLNS